MVITVSDVRQFMKDLPSDFVSDNTITKQIEFATWAVSKTKSDAATTEDVDKTVLICSAYYSTLAYMEEAERALGIIPPGMAVLVNELRIQKNMALEIVKRGAVYSIPLSIARMSTSMWSYTRAGWGR